MVEDPQTKYPRLAVGVILLRHRREVLLSLRKGTRGAGTFGLPGGSLEKNETLRMCAMREVEEETGLTDFVVNPLTSFCWQDGMQEYLEFVFWAKYRTGNPILREPERSEDWKWVDLKALKNLPAGLYKPAELALKRFVDYRRYHRLRRLLQTWLYQKKDIILFEDAPSIDWK